MTRRWKLTAAGAAAALVAAFTVAAIVDGSDPDATPAAAAAGSVAGVHVLSQAGSFAPTTSQAVSAIASQQSGLRTAMAFPGVNHYGVRVGWSAVETSAGVFDPAVFNRALQVITGSSDPAVNGDRLTVRIMAGRSTPARYLSGANACPTVTASNGTRAPAPFTRVGSSLVTNTCFVDAERRIMEAITTWALAQGGKVDEIHLSHYGLDWAEFNAGPEIQTIGDGASGFSASEATAMVAATNALVDIGVDLAATNDITYELPMSGKGPIMAATDGAGIADRVAQHVVDRLGSRSDEFLIQGNGWDDSGAGTNPRIWGAPDATTEARMDYVLTATPAGSRALLGVQDINPLDRTQAEWVRMFDYAESKQAVTAELYLGASFTGSSGTALRAALPGFVPYVPPATPPPSTTTTAPTTTTTTLPPTTTTTEPPTTTTEAPTTTTTVPVGQCVATWEGIAVESKATTQADCGLR